MGMMRAALDRSWIFVRHLARFSFKDSVKHKSKVIHRIFRLKKRKQRKTEESKWKNFAYWTALIALPLILLALSFSFISRPERFFSKSGGIYAPDMIKFLIFPGLSALAFAGWLTFSSLKNRKTKAPKKEKTSHTSVKIQLANSTDKNSKTVS